MTRIGYDCKGSNAQYVHDHFPKPDLIFWYGTGTSDIIWSAFERDLFPGIPHVEIDQGYKDKLPTVAQVRDVENGAWTVAAAVNRATWAAARPTIYCTRSTLPNVIAAGWKGDIWLAWPGWKGEPLPAHPGCTIVAVQDQWNQYFDRSTILDPNWPNQSPPGGDNMPFSITVVGRTAHLAIAPEKDATEYKVEYIHPDGKTVDVIETVPPWTGAAAKHINDLAVPGIAKGTVTVHATVGGKIVSLGTHTLP